MVHLLKITPVFVSVPDNTVQTADLLVGVDGRIIQGSLLLERGPALPQAERSC